MWRNICGKSETTAFLLRNHQPFEHSIFEIFLGTFSIKCAICLYECFISKRNLWYEEWQLKNYHDFSTMLRWFLSDELVSWMVRKKGEHVKKLRGKSSVREDNYTWTKVFNSKVKWNRSLNWALLSWRRIIIRIGKITLIYKNNRLLRILIIWNEWKASPYIH